MNLLGPTLDSAVRQFYGRDMNSNGAGTDADDDGAVYQKRVRREDNVGTYLTYVEEGDQQIQLLESLR